MYGRELCLMPKWRGFSHFSKTRDETWDIQLCPQTYKESSQWLGESLLRLITSLKFLKRESDVDLLF